MTFLGLRGVGLGISEDFPLNFKVDRLPLQLPEVGGQLGGSLLVLPA